MFKVLLFVLGFMGSSLYAHDSGNFHMPTSANNIVPPAMDFVGWKSTGIKAPAAQDYLFISGAGILADVFLGTAQVSGDQSWAECVDTNNGSYDENLSTTMITGRLFALTSAHFSAADSGFKPTEFHLGIGCTLSTARIERIILKYRLKSQ